MGPVAEVRLDRARAGKVSADQVQKKRKYQHFTAEQYRTLESTLGSGGSGAFGYIRFGPF